jgi:serine-threonine kinase receptor-associated protein
MSNTTLRQIPITCSGHTRPVVDLHFSGITPHSYFIISACKGNSTS